MSSKTGLWGKSDKPQWCNFGEYFVRCLQDLALWKYISSNIGVEQRPEDSGYQQRVVEMGSPDFDGSQSCCVARVAVVVGALSRN